MKVLKKAEWSWNMSGTWLGLKDVGDFWINRVGRIWEGFFFCGFISIWGIIAFGGSIVGLANLFHDGHAEVMCSFWEVWGYVLFVYFFLISVVVFLKFIKKYIVKEVTDSELLGTFFRKRYSKFFEKHLCQKSQYFQLLTKCKDVKKQIEKQLRILDGQPDDSDLLEKGRERLKKSLAGLDLDLQKLKKFREGMKAPLDKLLGMIESSQFKSFLKQLDAITHSNRLGNCVQDVRAGYLHELELFLVKFQSMEKEVRIIKFPTLKMKLK